MDITERSNPLFLPLVQCFDIRTLEVTSDTVYGIWADLRLAYFNPSWYRFAQDNQGEPRISRDWGLGRSVMDCVPDVFKSFYVNLYKSAFEQGRSTYHPVQHQYECSSPAVFRNNIMTLYPLGESEGIVVVNTTEVEVSQEEMGREPHKVHISSYMGDDGLIRMCANCRRTRNLTESDRWDWVPAFVAHMPLEVTHVLCSLCFNYYYGDIVRPRT